MTHKKSFYITTTLPYVNAEPHIGFAMELVRADVIARYKKLSGQEVFFNTGTDEHGSKIFKKAQEEGIETQKFVDDHSEKFRDLIKLLNIDPEVHFIRTTDQKHIKAAQEFWKRCEKDIEKKLYKIKYCVGCELEKTDSELESGHCVLHPLLEIEEREEENYFFKLSNYQDKLLNLYKSNPNFVIPDSRYNEIKAFVERGLEDFSISRLKSKMPWGVEVPSDSEHVMYVWFDALVSYISTLDWPQNEDNFTKFWREGIPTQYAGKDNLRQQSAMWQAMLMSAGLPNSYQIIINGFINSRGQKMSKSLGNVISPNELVEKYGVDATRYLLLRHINSFEDTDVTWERLDEWYESGLANGLGNLVSRVLTMANNYGVSTIDSVHTIHYDYFKDFDIQKYMNHVWELIKKTDKKIQDEEPYKKYKTNHEIAVNIVADLCTNLYEIAHLLRYIMPKTSEVIKSSLEDLKKPENLFPRINA